MLSIQDTKQRFIDFLFSRGEYIRSVDKTEYQTRCPYCGDSSTSLNTGHLYLHIDTDTNYNIPFICFKCQTKGIVTNDMLELMQNTDQELATGIRILNKKGKYKKDYQQESKYAYFEWLLPDEYKYPEKIRYLKGRIGVDFSKSDLEQMKVVTSLYDFLLLNEIKGSFFKKEQRMMLEKDYIGFLSSGNSHILFRDITDRHPFPWIKYPINEESKKNRVYYGFASEVDIFTKEEIIINLSEGVMDAIGIAHHLGYETNNTFHLAVTGTFFNTIIKRMISLGVFGSNVTLNVFADNDKNYNKHKTKTADASFHKAYLKNYVPLFKEVNLFYNLKGKDYGVHKENICEKKIRICMGG